MLEPGSRTSVPNMTEETANVPTPPSSIPSPSASVRKPPPKFSPGWRFYVCFSTLLVIALAAALDATSLSVALSVST